MTCRTALSTVLIIALFSAVAPGHPGGHHDEPMLMQAAPPGPVPRPEALRINIDPHANPWTSLELDADPDKFQFAIITDLTGGERPGVFAEAVDKLNLMKPQFVMSVGDFIQGYTQDRQEIDRQWRVFNSQVERLNMPFFYVVGNHDYSNEVMAEEWEKRFGRDYYHFVYRDVLFVCLNSDDPPGQRGAISQQQVEWFRQVLDQHPDVRWTLLFMHRPIWRERLDFQPWQQIHEALQGRKHTVFAGHLHVYRKDELEGFDHIGLATTGGGRQLPPPDVVTDAMGVILGRFDHFAWVTMTDDGPEIANVMLDGVWDRDLRSGEMLHWTNALHRQPPVYMEPVITREASFSRATTTLRIVNESNVMLTMRGRFEPHGQLRIEPRQAHFELPPESEKTLEVTLEATEGPVPLEKLVPVLLHWSLRYATTELPQFNRDFNVRSIKRFVPQQVLPIAQAREPIVIDGRLDDWPDLPIVVDRPAQVLPGPEHWRGPEDASFRFGVKHDERYLYVGVEVIDDHVATDPALLATAPAAAPADDEGEDIDAGPPRRRDYHRDLDGIEIRIDARPDPLRSHGRGMRQMRDFLLIAMNPGETMEDFRILQPYRLRPRGIDFASIRTDRGYTAEAAIPVEYLNQQQGGDWSAVRINITVNDYDADGVPVRRLHWQPNWYSDENYVGSGTFSRE